MATHIARKYDFVDGTKIYSAQVDEELDQLVSVRNADADANEAAFATKVDKVDGKDLSDNNYSDTEMQANADNTSARHTHPNKAVVDSIIEVTQSLGVAPDKIPSEKAVSDALIAGSLGDMLRSIYDMDHRNMDVFRYIDSLIEFVEEDKALKDTDVGILVGTVRNIEATDRSMLIRCQSSSPQTINIPMGFDGSDHMETVWLREGTGTLTFTADAGVTLISSDNKRSVNKTGEAVTLKRLDTNVYLLIGSLV